MSKKQFGLNKEKQMLKIIVHMFYAIENLDLDEIKLTKKEWEALSDEERNTYLLKAVKTSFSWDYAKEKDIVVNTKKQLKSNNPDFKLIRDFNLN